MPQVPNLTNFDVSPGGGSGARVSAPPPQSSAGEQLQQLGGAVQRAGSAATDIFTNIQQQANQTRVDDAINQAKERALHLTFDPQEGFTTLKGINALERPNGQGLAAEYGGKLKESVDQIASGLGNDAQRRAFSLASNDIATNFNGDLMRHEAGEFKDYTLSVREGTIENAQNEMAKKYADPDVVNRSTAAIDAAVYSQGQLLGKSATWIEAQQRNMKSGAMRIAMSSALQNNDISFVEDFLTRHSGDMNADDALAVEGAVTKQKGMTYASQVSSEVFAGTGVGGTAAESVRMPVAGRVSSGYSARVPFRTANGQMSSSNHDGIDIVATLGTPVKADAAGRVIKAGPNGGYGNYVEVEHADGSKSFFGHLNSIGVKIGDTVSGGGQLGTVGQTGNATGPHLHWGMVGPDGKSIDPRAVRTVGGGHGVGANASLLDMIQAVRSDPRLIGHPEWQTAAEEQVKTLYLAQEEGKKRGDEEAAGAAMRQLVSNGGKMTPQLAASVPDKALPEVMSFANSMEAAARRDDNQGDPILWAGLKTQIASGAINNAQQLLQYAPRLSKNDFHDLTTDIVSINNGDQKKIDSYQTLNRTLSFLHSEMLAAKIDWTPDNKDPDAAQRFGDFQNALLRQIDTLEKTQGKPLTAQESRKVALDMLAEVPHTGGWFSSPKRGYQLNAPGLPLSSIPIEVQQRAAGYLRANGKAVTEHNIQVVVARPDLDLSPKQ